MFFLIGYLLIELIILVPSVTIASKFPEIYEIGIVSVKFKTCCPVSEIFDKFLKMRLEPFMLFAFT